MSGQGRQGQHKKTSANKHVLQDLKLGLVTDRTLRHLLHFTVSVVQESCEGAANRNPTCSDFAAT